MTFWSHLQCLVLPWARSVLWGTLSKGVRTLGLLNKSFPAPSISSYPEDPFFGVSQGVELYLLRYLCYMQFIPSTTHTDLYIPTVTDTIKSRFLNFISNPSLQPNRLLQALSIHNNPLDPPRRLNHKISLIKWSELRCPCSSQEVSPKGHFFTQV